MWEAPFLTNTYQGGPWRICQTPGRITWKIAPDCFQLFGGLHPTRRTDMPFYCTLILVSKDSGEIFWSVLFAYHPGDDKGAPWGTAGPAREPASRGRAAEWE